MNSAKNWYKRKGCLADQFEKRTNHVTVNFSTSIHLETRLGAEDVADVNAIAVILTHTFDCISKPSSTVEVKARHQLSAKT